MTDLSDYDLHDANACGGLRADCAYCDADDELRAAQVKRATRALDREAVTA